MRRLLILVALALGAWAPAESARADTGSITVNSAVGDLATATFTVTKATCDSPYFCGWFAIATRHLAAEACHTGAPVWVGSSRAGVLTATETETNFYSFAREGAHRLCLFVYSAGTYTLLAQVVYAQDAPPPPPTPTAPAAPSPPPGPVPAPPTPTVPEAPAPTSLVTSSMPRSVGRTERSSERLAIFPGNAPYDVDTGRFVSLVRAAAARWDIVTGGVSWRTMRFARPDGRNAIGFAPRPEGVLGTTSIWSARVYRKRRACSGGRCRWVRRSLGRQVVERDVAIDPDVPWQQGPQYPSAGEFDLETVIAHELGHWAGNDHRDSCAHLMTRAIDAGDWWRDSGDFHFQSCEGGLSAVASRQRRSLQHVERVHDLVLPSRVSERAAGAYARTAWARSTALAER